MPRASVWCVRAHARKNERVSEMTGTHVWCPPDLTCSQVSQLREVLTAIKRQSAASLPATPFQDSMTIETTLIDQHTTTSYPVGCRKHTTPPDYTNTTTNTGPQWL